MKIREAKIFDAVIVKELYNELREYELSLLKDEIKKIQINWERKKDIKSIRKFLRSKNIKIFVAEDCEKTVGFIIGEVSKGVKYKEGSFDIFVKPDFRGKGIGKNLMKEMTDWFKNKSCKSIRLNVYSSNKEAKEFYKNLNFKLISETYKKRI